MRRPQAQVLRLAAGSPTIDAEAAMLRSAPLLPTQVEGRLSPVTLAPLPPAAAV